MKYAILIYERESDFSSRTDELKKGNYWAAYQAYTAALVESGVLLGGDALQGPETATTLRIQDGKAKIQDGPFIETKEQLGGFYLIEVPNLDEAMEWALRCPAASSCSVEVRPILPMQT